MFHLFLHIDYKPFCKFILGKLFIWWVPKEYKVVLLRYRVLQQLASLPLALIISCFVFHSLPLAFFSLSFTNTNINQPKSMSSEGWQVAVIKRSLIINALKSFFCCSLIKLPSSNDQEISACFDLIIVVF